MQRRLTSSRVAIALALISFPFIMGCGSNNSAPIVPQQSLCAAQPSYPGCNATCAANPTYPGCPTAAGYLGYGGTGTCVPPTSPISFTGTGIYMGASEIAGGMIPPGSADPAAGQTLGQIIVGVGTTSLYGTTGGLTFSKNAVDATVMISISSGGYGLPGYPTTTLPTLGIGTTGIGTTSVTGMIQINPNSLTELYTVAQSLGLNSGSLLGGVSPYGTSPYGTTYPSTLYPGIGGTSSVCVSSLAFDSGYSGTTLINGTVYLYLDGSQHGWSFPL